ncbi:hypothetical protein Bca4012_071768 [Brassica carinata]|uniref:Uncharacterized protein n=1 Tax=Brassica carinata TaxID=52824 RepID=A0A8X7U898_BRACI|nr:hypothetical protein Bca52824_064032 [Brassica carinata]
MVAGNDLTCDRRREEKDLSLEDLSKPRWSLDKGRNFFMSSAVDPSCGNSIEHKLAVTGTSVSPRQEFATTHMSAQKDTASKTLFLFGKMLELGFEHDEVMLGFLVSERELRELHKRLINAMNG